MSCTRLHGSKLGLQSDRHLLVLLAFAWAALIDWGLRRLDVSTFDTIKKLSLRWVRQGGHLAFAAGLDLGEASPAGLAGQAIGWLARQVR